MWKPPHIVFHLNHANKEWLCGMQYVFHLKYSLETIFSLFFFFIFSTFVGSTNDTFALYTTFDCFSKSFDRLWSRFFSLSFIHQSVKCIFLYAFDVCVCLKHLQLIYTMQLKFFCFDRFGQRFSHTHKVRNIKYSLNSFFLSTFFWKLNDKLIRLVSFELHL